MYTEAVVIEVSILNLILLLPNWITRYQIDNDVFLRITKQLVNLRDLEKSNTLEQSRCLDIRNYCTNTVTVFYFH